MHTFLGTPTDHPTPHVVGPDDATVFAPSSPRSKWSFPIATVDGRALGAEHWPTPAHFIYCEYRSRPLAFRVESGRYVLETDPADIDRDLTIDAYELTERPSRWRGSHLEFTRVDAPDVAALKKHAMQLRVNERSGFDPFGISLGGAPDWLQMPEWPSSPEGSPLIFIGQLNAAWLSSHLADYVLYLFGSEDGQRVVQVAQVS